MAASKADFSFVSRVWRDGRRYLASRRSSLQWKVFPEYNSAVQEFSRWNLASQIRNLCHRSIGRVNGRKSRFWCELHVSCTDHFLSRLKFLFHYVVILIWCIQDRFRVLRAAMTFLLSSCRRGFIIQSGGICFLWCAGFICNLHRYDRSQSDRFGEQV